MKSVCEFRSYTFSPSFNLEEMGTTVLNILKYCNLLFVNMHFGEPTVYVPPFLLLFTDNNNEKTSLYFVS